jgi:hypothetical protein
MLSLEVWRGGVPEVQLATELKKNTFISSLFTITMPIYLFKVRKLYPFNNYSVIGEPFIY